ncbi:hypothetical protein [Microcoleus sp. FACHB-1515]|nr:hypothetical protein [Microcoleus sp. FACHB-1515]
MATEIGNSIAPFQLVSGSEAIAHIHRTATIKRQRAKGNGGW